MTRRDELLRATITQLEKRGLAQTRVADVAHALGCSPALVFYHFRTKDELVARAFELAVESDLARLDAAERKHADPLARVRAILRLYGPVGPAPTWQLWIDAWALAQREPVIRRVLRRSNRRWSAVLRDAVVLGVAAGVFSCADPDASVARISALLDGLSVSVLVYESITRTQLRTWIAEAVAQELGVTARLLR
ncbi:MAG: TetR/AcrR family transcriptional regulator [Nocardioidaceae bacterium]